MAPESIRILIGDPVRRGRQNTSPRRITQVPASTELAEVGTQVDTVLQAGLETGPVGIGFRPVAGLGFTVGPPMRHAETPRLLDSTGPAPTGHSPSPGPGRCRPLEFGQERRGGGGDHRPASG